MISLLLINNNDKISPQQQHPRQSLTPGTALAPRDVSRTGEAGSCDELGCVQHKQPHMGIVWTQGAPWPFLLSPDAIELT